MQILETFFAVLVPFLVKEAERIIGKGAPDGVQTPAGAAKHQWVTEAVHEFVGVLETKVPDWVKPEIDLIEPAIDAAIEKALDDLGL